MANNGRLHRDCAEPILGLKSKPGGQAATKDDAIMEPATEARNVISFAPFSLDASRRLLVEFGIELGAQTLDILIELVPRPNEVVTKNGLLARVFPDATVEEGSLPLHIVDLRKALVDAKDGARHIATLKGRRYCLVEGDRVEEIAAAARFPHTNLPASFIGMVGRECADDAYE
jgi:DNA-binding winged helix-turn-helix (wHTH) protein